MVYIATDAVGNDVFAYTVATGARVQINAGAVVHQFEAVATRAGESAVVYTVPAAGSIHVYNVATATLYNDAAQTYVFDAVTSDGRAIYSQTNAGGGMFSHDHVANTTQTVVSGTGVPTFHSEGAAPGDVVFSVDVGGQDDLFLWVDAVTTVVTVSDLGVDETFQAVNPNGRILYTHVVGSNTNLDLFIFDPIGMSRTQLTQQDPIGNTHDHAVVASYQADQS